MSENKSLGKRLCRAGGLNPHPLAGKAAVPHHRLPQVTSGSGASVRLSELKCYIADFMSGDDDHAIRQEYALKPEITGIPYFDEPLLGCAAADDPLFSEFRDDPGIVGGFLRLPSDWLPGAVSVVSIFFPFTKAVRDSNRDGIDRPSDVWLHARIEGHAFLEKALAECVRYLKNKGFRVSAPSLSPDFSRRPNDSIDGRPAFVSNWSERHTAYICGLGTFSLSRHIITGNGVCGRFGSLITDALIEPTPRPYSDPFEYCTMCGACVNRCPVNAIRADKDIIRGKNNMVCSAFLNEQMKLTAPRYGCGKCQLNVPCETGIPRAS